MKIKEFRPQGGYASLVPPGSANNALSYKLKLVSYIYFSNVPLPCFLDIPLFTFEDLVEEEKDVVATLPSCYTGPACSAKNTKL